MKFTNEIARKFKSEEIGVIPTDTIYGVAASALSKKAVARAYVALKRNPQKPFIILVYSLKDLSRFDIKIDGQTRRILDALWPGKISVILPCLPAKTSVAAGLSAKWKYLHRGSESLAFRVPKKPSLIALLEKTGPLISTSVNVEGAKPAETIAEAQNSFGDRIDFYVGSGKIKSLPSTLVEINEGKLNVLRQGQKKLNKNLLIDTCKA